MVCSSAAIAKAPRAHATRVSGVVVSINAKRHILKLRVKHSAKRNGLLSRAASAGGGPTINVAFDNATVKGPHGAVAVGDEVTVTTSGAVGSNTTASSIAVIGQPNGGDAGKGAAIPGEVTSVDAANGTLTLAVHSTDSHGSSQASTVIITVSPSTILAVTDTNGDGSVTLADIEVGDHLVVFTSDASGNPIAALGILDASHTGGNHRGGGDGTGDITKIPGTATAVDTTNRTLSLTVSDGPLAGQTITVDLAPHASFGGEDSGDGNVPTLADIAVGDTVGVYTHDVTATPIVAVGVVDRTTHPSGGSAPAGGASPTTYDGFNGTVTALATDRLQVTVGGDGPLGGQTVTVGVTAGTHYRGISGFGEIKVGDQIRFYTTTLDPSALVAVYLGDGPVGSGDAPAPPAAPAQPTRFGGTVTAVRGDGLTVKVSSGGPLSGQTVIVSVPPTASLAGAGGAGGGTESLANISVGDLVEISTNSASATPVVASGVVDDSHPAHS